MLTCPSRCECPGPSVQHNMVGNRIKQIKVQSNGRRRISIALNYKQSRYIQTNFVGSSEVSGSQAVVFIPFDDQHFFLNAMSLFFEIPFQFLWRSLKAIHRKIGMLIKSLLSVKAFWFPLMISDPKKQFCAT